MTVVDPLSSRARRTVTPSAGRMAAGEYAGAPRPRHPGFRTEVARAPRPTRLACVPSPEFRPPVSRCSAGPATITTLPSGDIDRLMIPTSSNAPRGSSSRASPTPRRRESRRHYVPLHRPRAGDALPMIVSNGRRGGTDGVRQTTQGLPLASAWPEDWPFIIVPPQKPLERPGGEDHVSLVKACMGFVRARYSIDERRAPSHRALPGGHGTRMIASMMPGASPPPPVCGYGSGGLRRRDRPCLPSTKSPRPSPTRPSGLPGDKTTSFPCAQTKSMIDAIRRRRASPAQHRSRLPTVAPSRPIHAPHDHLPDLNHGCWDRAYRGTPTPDAPSESIAQWFLRFRRDAPTDR